MVESSPILKQVTGNKSGEILRSKSSGQVSIDSLEDTIRALNNSPESYKDKNDQNRNIRSGVSVEEINKGLYLMDRFK